MFNLIQRLAKGHPTNGLWSQVQIIIFKIGVSFQKETKFLYC